MKRSELTRSLLTVLGATTLLAGASAQAPAPDRAEVEIARNDNTAIQTLQRYLQSNTLRASELIGTDVETPNGDEVGDVADILTAEPGQMMHVVVAIEDGDRRISIPFEDIRMDTEDDDLLTSASQPQSAQAPSSAQSARGIADIIGASVIGSDGEHVGEVDDVILSTAGVGMIRAVLQVGGVVGVGEKRIALPLEELNVERAGRDEPAVRVDMTLDTLQRQPEFSYEQ
jgi:sporulation protein YlmC with PRC-barrel domain